MFDLAFLVGLPALTARTVVSVVDSACEYAIGAQEKSKAVTWTVDILGKPIKIHTDYEYDSVNELFEYCRYPFESCRVYDSTGGDGKYLVLWCLLRWACCGDDMYGLAKHMEGIAPEQANTLRCALDCLPHMAKSYALDVAALVIAQDAVPDSSF
jgi:hypothetical protein